MKPGARIQAAIELLDQIGASTVPADRLVGNYFRSRRYAGSKDRRAVTEMVYDILRRRGEYAWIAGGSSGSDGSDGRPLALAQLISQPAMDAGAIAALFDGTKYSPPELNAEEQALLDSIKNSVESNGENNGEAPPAWVTGNYPEWLAPGLQRRFGADMDREMAAMQGRAGVDLRVNVLKTTAEKAAAKLAEGGMATTPGTLAPDALRLDDRRSLANHPLYQSGVIEIQDEGSQLVALLCAAQPGQQVVDYCAGAGGKSLALAAGMNNKGQIFAFDNNPRRLRPLRERLQRAGARNIQVHALADAAAIAALGNLKGKVDRLLLDVPCTGSGAWRRNPESKWRLTPEQLAQYAATQDDILNRAAPLVAPGGRLIYATCSILVDENEDRVDAFLAAHADFDVMPIAQVWDDVLESACPCDDPYLRLTPAQHGTDGFFVAVLQRKQT